MKDLSLEEVVKKCTEESRHSRQEEVGFCFEVFRRAFDDHDAAAWGAIERQYFPLLFNWARARTETKEDAETLAREALVKGWRVLSGSTVPLADRFAHTGAVLRYLYQCVVTAALDQQRQARGRQLLRERLEASTGEASGAIHPGEQILDRLCQEQRIKRVRQWLDEAITDPQEKRVLALTFEEDLSPSEIVMRFPLEFPDAQSVNRIKERVLKRARRAVENS